jgi:hypothetical protein
MDHLVTFGCEVVYYEEKQNQDSKSSPSGKKGIIFGYQEGHKNYCIWSLKKGCIKFTHNLWFLKDSFPGVVLVSTKPLLDPLIFDLPKAEGDILGVSAPQSGDSPPDNSRDRDIQGEGDTTQDSASQSDDSCVEEILAPPRFSSATGQKKGYALVPHYDVAPRDILLLLSVDNIIIGKRKANKINMEPSPKNLLTYQKAVTFPNVLQCVAAIDNKFQNMERHGVWSIHPLAPGCKPFSCKWVFKTKFNMFGEINKFKAFLVVCGFLQKEGINYTGTFSPAGCLQALRTIFAIAAYLNLDFHQMDVKCVFLNGKPDRNIFIKVPKGVKVDLKPKEGFQLNQSLYGLKQSPHMWHIAFSEFFAQINFFQISWILVLSFVRTRIMRLSSLYTSMI